MSDQEDGQFRDVAVLLVVGVDRQGKRGILGIPVPLSEAEIH